MYYIDMGGDKHTIIRGVYYDQGSGFGSINATYKQAHHMLDTITLNVVKDFLSRQTSGQTKSHRAFNSYVAEAPLQELQMDIADFIRSAEVNDGYRYAFCSSG